MANHILFNRLNSDIDEFFRKPNLKRTLIKRLNANVEEDEQYTDVEIFQYLSEASDAQLNSLIRVLYQALELPTEDVVPETDTEPNTEERLAFIFEKIGLPEFTEQFARKMLVKDEDDHGTSIIDERFLDWYTPERQERYSNYWDAYRGVLEQNGWDADAINSVDQQATAVVKRIEDPLEPVGLASRGLVVGYVQSGKTANFTAVMAKAIDAGYRMIIVLAGTLDNLRNQTQRRLDMELLGREAVVGGRELTDDPKENGKLEAYFRDDPDWIDGKFVSHGSSYGRVHGFPRIRRLTTSLTDFATTKSGLQSIELGDDIDDNFLEEEKLLRLPCHVAVVKKNAQVLKKLNAQIGQLRSNRNLSKLPVLIIDDESDQASINTIKNKQTAEEKERTAVNAQIVELLKRFPRAQYVGYTATPFANVFVNPEDPEDLYPKDFVLMLSKPKAYRGADWFHDSWIFEEGEDPALAESNSKAFVRLLEEAPKRENEEFDATRKEEYGVALDMFVLTAAIKKFREAKNPKLRFKHHTMLVHESTKNKQHGKAVDDLVELWHQRGYGLGRSNDRLRSLYEEDVKPVLSVPHYVDGNPVPASFDELIPFIRPAIGEMMADVVGEKNCPILQVDSEGGEEADFERSKVWKVLVGGAKLSRGYTVEGLTVSYFRRKAGSADTLMQTGRWFGFRKGYQDLVRLYAPQSLVEMFEASMRDEDQFREQVAAYAEENEKGRPVITPAQLAPLVQQSLGPLLPTARNKMFNAYVQSMAAAPGAFEVNGAIKGEEGKQYNYETVGKPILDKLGDLYKVATYRREGRLGAENSKISAGYMDARFALINADEFIDLIEGMAYLEDEVSDGEIKKRGTYYNATIKPRLEYIKDLKSKGEITEAAIMLPIPQGAQKVKLEANRPEVPVVGRVRRSAKFDRNDIASATRRHTYPLVSAAMGKPLNTVRQSELINLRDNFPELHEKFDNAAEVPQPFQPSKTRAALAVYFFDEREAKERKAKPFAELWNEKGSESIGVQFVFSTPHEAINAAGLVTWGVHRPAAAGELVIDASEATT